jgi:hypothetical protein
MIMESRVKEALEIVVRVARLGNYDSNVIGMAAEVIAEEEFGMIKTPRGRRHVDGTWFKDDREHTVQVKAWSEDRIRKYREFTYFRLKENALPDVLLCVLIYCSKPDYKIIYNGPPSSVGYVEKNGRDRVVRFGHMMSAEQIDSLLLDLGVEVKAKSLKQRSIRGTETGGRKMCAICGVRFPIEEFHYGNRLNNSYCTACCKAHSEAYARGGTEATRRFRDEKRRNWKNGYK